MEVNQQCAEDFLSHGSPVVTMALPVVTVMTGWLGVKGGSIWATSIYLFGRWFTYPSDYKGLWIFIVVYKWFIVVDNG